MDGKQNVNFKVENNFAKVAIYLYLDIRYPDLKIKVKNLRDNEV